MSPITSHVLDTSRGRPAVGVAVVLEKQIANDSWTPLANGTTNDDGRLAGLMPDTATLTPGIYRLRFGTAAYYLALGIRCFYPEVQIIFHVDDAAGHYHVPLLISPFGYSTYRGS